MQENKNSLSFLSKRKNINFPIFEKTRMFFRCVGSVLSRTLYFSDSEENTEKSKKTLKILTNTGYFTFCFLLGLSRISSLSLSPFALSVLCASSGKYSIFAYMGTGVSCLFCGVAGMVQFITFTLIYLLRKTFSSSEFSEKFYIRFIYTLLSSIFIGTSQLLSKDISFDEIIALVSYISLALVCVYLYFPILSESKKKMSHSLYFMSLSSLCVCMVPSFSTFSFFDINTGLIFASIITLCFAATRGPIYGCASGFIMGFACSNPLFSASLGAGGLFCGYLFIKSKLLSVFGFTAASVIASLYTLGFSAFSDFAPYGICAALIFVLIYKHIPEFFTQNCLPYSEKQNKTKSEKSGYDKVSDSLSGLSAILYRFAEHLKAPSTSETGGIFDNAFSEICRTCSMNSMCYAKKECNLQSVRNKVISNLHTSTLSESFLSPLLLNKCIKVKELCEYINRHYSELSFFTMKSNRTHSVACLYNSMSRLIRSVSKEEDNSAIRDDRLEKTLAEALKKISVEFSAIYAVGARTKNISIHGIKADKIPCSAKELSDYLSEECKIKFAHPSFDLSDCSDMVMKLSRAEIISVEYAQCSISKDEVSVNGDTVSFFDTDKGFFYSVIADGMGSGKEAAATSRLSCIFLEKMLSVGTSKKVCLEMLNNLLLSKNDETFSSVDLLEIDKLNAGAYFIKAGAAPSYILRKSRLYKISSETPPVGIIHSFSAESTKFNIEKGDVIFMVSDGVIQSENDGMWLSELIGMDSECEPALLAAELIERAKAKDSRKDDASACVIKII